MGSEMCIRDSPQSITPILPQRTVRRPTQIPNLIIASPARRRTSHIISPGSGSRAINPLLLLLLGWIRIEQIPYEHQTIVRATCERPTARGAPFDAICRRGMAVELEQCLAWLAHVEDANDFRVLREGG